MDNRKYNSLILAVRNKASEILPQGSKVTLFGSRARGDEHPDSDWDIQILIPGAEKLRLNEISKYSAPFDELGLDFGEIINTRVYSVSGWLRRSFLPFFKNVTEEGIVIYQS